MPSSRFRPLVRLACWTAAVSFVLISGCLDRPVSPSEPSTTNQIIEPVRQERIERIDLLFMIDNSASMADKQLILASAVPELVRRLVQPSCIGSDGKPTGNRYPCDEGSRAEFEPVVDIHVGVVSSSLGAHGGDFCADQPPTNDKAHLLPTVRPDPLPTDGNGFLWWNPGQEGFSDADVTDFATRFQAHVQNAREDGCGYEASLEAWYRFLIDPSPPDKVVREGNRTVASGVDEILLQQRSDFLRDDSLVAIVMLSDENDCSIRDGDVGWYVTSNIELARPTSACATNPNDPCCRSCVTVEANGPPTGCTPLCEDPACQPACSAKLAPDEDKRNLRCYEQKRRFGIDFLYPTARYVNALTQPVLCTSRPDLDASACPDAERTPNPLYGGKRTPDLVFFAGILGVPWQDIATADTLGLANELDYMTARELHDGGRWPWLTPTDGAPPSDPLMQESTQPRTGSHPSGDPALAPALPDAAATANAANGHEWRTEDVSGGNPGSNGDLQYACTFPIAPRDCSGSPLCDCYQAGQPGYTQNKPLCQGPAGYGEEQVYAKAYPGLRQLEVLRDFGENSIVASICPKVQDTTSADYGYNPAVEAIVDRLADVLGGRCLPRQLEVKEGEVPCKLVESLPEPGACDCTAPGRQPIEPDLAAPARRELEKLQVCGPESASGASCESLCLCAVTPYTGDALHACQTETSFQADEGWCYVDPAQDYPAPNPGTDLLVERCAAHERRLLRFEPASGATALIACQGAAVTGK